MLEYTNKCVVGGGIFNWKNIVILTDDGWHEVPCARRAHQTCGPRDPAGIA